MEKQDTNKFNICDLLIVILLIGVVLSNFIWLKLDEYPIEGHDLLGVIPAVQVYKELLGMKNTHKLFDHILGRYYGSLLNYPPLSFLVLVLFYFLFGLQGQMVAMVNSPYIIVTIVSVYLIGKNIFNRPTGLLAAFILSSFPGFIAFSRVYWIEFGLMAYVSLDLYLLLKTNLFENRKYSILLGITLALSFLHKAEFIPFVMGPFLLVILKSESLKNIFQRRWSNRLINLTITIALALGLSSFWWVRYGINTFGRMFSVFYAPIEIDITYKSTYLQKILAGESLNFYLNSIYCLLGSILFILFFVAIIFMLKKLISQEKKRFYLLYLILWFTIPFIMLTFTLLQVKYPNKILSLFPAIAIIISASAYFLKNRLCKISLVVLTVLYCLNLHLSSFYPIKNPPYLVKILNALNRSTVKLERLPAAYNFYAFYPPRQERLEFAIKEILEFIKNTPYKKPYPMVLVVFERPAFKNCIFYYYSLIGGYPSSFLSTHFKLASELSESDYIVIEATEGESIAQILSRDYNALDLERANLKKMFKNGLGDFELIKIYKIPNGKASAYIYKRKANS